MNKDEIKTIVEKLDLELAPVAIKYLPVKPGGIKKSEERLAFCQYVTIAQKSDEPFYISVDNDSCYGKMSLGMIPKPAVTANGQAGFDFDMYKTPAACRKLYQELPVIVPGTVNHVLFTKWENCDFDPDLVMFFADMDKAEIIMRATSYISGDFWESKSSPVISCAWMYAYPVISGKVNHITTGFYHGLKRRKAFPAGLRQIAVPFNKLDEMVQALKDMPWIPIAFREDEESRQELKRRMDHWQEMGEELNSHCDLH